MANNAKPTPRVVVCQHGARHRYAIPRMLEKSDMLAGLYTDSSDQSRLGRVAARLPGLPFDELKRLAGRKISGVPSRKISSSDICFWRTLPGRLFGRREKGMRLYQRRHQWLSEKMIGWGDAGGNLLYSMYHENLNFVRWMKARGSRVVVDVFISPTTNKTMGAEFVKFPDWGGRPSDEAVLLEDELWRQTVLLADVLVCPSEWVAEGVKALSPDAEGRIRIVPYGCSIDYQGRKNKPVVGRVLFAGGEALRKGLHYLAEAATLLKKQSAKVLVRVAGDFPTAIIEHPACADLVFLGKLDSARMKDEYLSADCFVLPSLSEGFAGVVAEAIGAGCPVVVTREAGSPVVSEREGLVVPARDAAALGRAIRRIVEDRAFRESCAIECERQIPFYSEEAWRERLIPILEDAL